MILSPQIRAPYAVVFDLEFTAWEGSMAHRWLRPGEYTEIVQIGALKVDVDFVPQESLDILVRPRLNPVLSPYLERLTGITTEEVRARGIDFEAAYRAFVDFVADLPILAFGRDDLIFADNLRLFGIKGAPPLPPYANVIPWLGAQGIDMRGLHACDVGPVVGVPFEGHKHNALDDARSVAAGIRALLGRGAKLPLAA
jgi:inhibitor of KinA sporulation pathway (predicted exonuclease)